MTTVDLRTLIREQMCSEINVRATDARGIAVAIPLLLGDGDSCRVFVRPQDDGTYLVTDGGHVVSTAFSEGIDLLSVGHADRFRRVASFYGAQEFKGELRTAVKNDELGDAVFGLIQACIETSRLTEFPAENVKRKTEFSKKFRRVVEHVLSRAQLHKNWHDPKLDPKKSYRVDYRVGSDHVNFLLYGVGSSQKSWKSIAASKHYKLSQLPDVRPVFAYSDSAKADESAFEALQDTAYRVFSFEHEKRQLQEFLREEVHAQLEP